MDLVTLALIVLTTARLTRLVTEDRVTDSIRHAVTRWAGEDSMITYWIHCPWCVSMYVGPLVTWAAYAWGGSSVFTVIAAGLSASYLTGYLAAKTED